jgi:hypothetical protein
MASFDFYCDFNLNIQNLGGSGIGFYGPGGFGSSIKVGDYQDNTYITDASGAVQGPQGNNVKYVHPNSGMIPTNNTLLLRNIPNYQGSVNVRFSNPTAVQITNATATYFDRVNTNNPPSGLICKMAQLIHPWTTQTPAGSGDTTWWTPGGSGGTVNGTTYDPPIALANSPGTSGWSPNGAATTDTQHDWYLACSVQVSSIGSKLFALSVQLEYL